MQGISHKDQNQLEKNNVICNFCNKDIPFTHLLREAQSH